MIKNEEKVLEEGLDGYKEYKQKARYKVTKFWGYKKQDFVKCLKSSKLQSLVVPRMRLELTRTLLPKGF